MKGLLIDKNDTDGFIILKDDSIISIPLSNIKDNNIGSNVQFSSLKSNHYFPNSEQNI